MKQYMYYCILLFTGSVLALGVALLIVVIVIVITIVPCWIKSKNSEFQYKCISECSSTLYVGMA